MIVVSGAFEGTVVRCIPSAGQQEVFMKEKCLKNKQSQPLKTNQLQYLRVFNQSEQNIMGYIVMHNQSTLSTEEDWKLQSKT